MRRMACQILLFSLLWVAPLAHAADGPAHELGLRDPSAPPPWPRWLTGAAAVVPGLAVHGTGTYLAGDRQAASALMTAEGIGLGLIAAGILPLILTDASGQNVDLSVAALTAGTGLLLTSWMADVYGATVGPRPAAPSGLAPMLEPYAGYAHVYDPQFDYRHFSVVRLDARLGRWRLSPRAWIATDSDNRQLGMDAAVRLIGPRPDRRAVDGSYLEVQLGATHHRFGDDRFSVLTTELQIPARLDLQRLGRLLAGSFVDFHLGWAFQAFDYWLPGRGMGTDINALLLVRFAFGIYLGDPGGPRGDVQLYYDHRHDGLAGGLAADIHDPQFLGHVGLAGSMQLGQGWAVKLMQEIGSASITNLGLCYQWGGRP